MARRFGRNQRRRMREEIAALEVEVSDLKEARVNNMSHLRKLEHEVETWDDEISRLLGPFSSFRKDTQRSSAMRGPIHHMHVGGATPAPSVQEFVSDEKVMLDPVERMHRFVLSMDDLPHEAVRMIRFKESNGKLDVAYSVSTLQIAQCGFTKRDTHHLAMKIATGMAELLNTERTK